MGNFVRSWSVVSTLVCIATLCALTRTAAAQKRRPEAEYAFKQGKDAMAKQDYDLACQRFRASQDLEPRASTLMNLADCHQAKKKLVTAWGMFIDAARLADNSDDKIERALGDPARAKAKALEDRLSTLEIVVPGAARLPGLVISRDGEVIVEGQWNSEVPIDGGEYRIVARARGTITWEATIAIASEHDKKQVTIPILQTEAPMPADPPPPPVVERTPLPDVETAEPEEVPEAAEAPSSFTGMRKAAIGVAAVGVVALAGGAAFGLKANSTQADADDICPSSECTDPEAIRLNDDAKSAATKANIFLIGGGVAVGTGIALWFLGAPKPHQSEETSVRPHVGPNLVGISIAGAF
jgi:hypothetical protein